MTSFVVDTNVAITPCSDDRLGFKELPENDLDKSDRKFLAAAWLHRLPL